MADPNKIFRRAIPEKQFAIKTTEILNFGVEGGNPAVVLIGRRIINNDSESSEAKELKNASRNSPWTDDSLGKEFSNKSLKTTTSKDPVVALQDFVNALSRG